MNTRIKTLASLLLALSVAVTLLAFANGGVLAQDQDSPIVIINKPPSNSSYMQGDIISIESLSASPVGIVEVELYVDGQLVQRDDTPGALPETQFTLIQRWIANLPGSHVVTVRAIDSENRTGQAAINVIVANIAPTPVPAPTLAPPPTPTPVTCVLDARFVRDVTLPDNTVLAPGTSFVKTWTIQNSGTCAWDPQAVAVFTGGARMAGGSPHPVGALAAGATMDISINFVAPGSPGTYRSSWKMQSGSGVQFGQPFYVQIVIPGPPTPVPPPPPPPPPPNQGCQGAPIISFFTADNTDIQHGQGTTLRWGLVSNADSVYLETPHGSGGVPSPGETGVNPKQTATFILAAYCKGFRVQSQVTVNVHGGGGGGGGGGDGAQGSIDGMEVGTKNNKTQVRVFYSWNGAGGPAEVCASAPGTDRPCTNARPDAPYAVLNLNQPDAAPVTACLLDRDGREVACGSQ